MPRYRVYLECNVSTVVYVDADDKVQARELATCGDLPTLNASNHGMDIAGEWDVPDAKDIGASLPSSYIEEADEEDTE